MTAATPGRSLGAMGALSMPPSVPSTPVADGDTDLGSELGGHEDQDMKTEEQRAEEIAARVQQEAEQREERGDMAMTTSTEREREQELSGQ